MVLNRLGKIYIVVLVVCIVCFAVITGIKVHNSNTVIKEEQVYMDAYNAKVESLSKGFESNKEFAENFDVAVYDYLGNKAELKANFPEDVMVDIETFKRDIELKIEEENELARLYEYEINEAVTPADNVKNEILFDVVGEQVVDLFYYDDIFLKIYIKDGEIVSSNLV